MKAALYLRQMARESRGQRRRLGFFLACLAVGVAAVTAVAGLTASLDQAIRNDARQLLAADLVVEGRSSLPMPAALEERLAAIPGAERAEVKELVTIVAAAAPAPPAPEAAAPPAPARPAPSRLVELKAVSPGYPFYGAVTTDPQRPLAELLDAETVLAAPELAALGLEVGGTMRVGTRAFRIAGTISAEPDRLGGAFAAGPRVMITLEGLARADLEQRGSRAERRLLLKLPAVMSKEQVKALAASLKAQAGRDFRVETYAEGQPALRQGLARTDRFLGLVALVSLLAGGIGVAQTVRAWLASRMDSIAVLKCLGLTPREVFVLYFGQTALLGLAGSAAGVAAGLAVMMAVPRVLSDLVPAAAVHLWQPVAMLRGLALGTGVALLFSLQPLASLFRVPPARVLRRDAEPLPASRAVTLATLAALAGGIFALAAAQSGSVRLAAGFTAGIAVVTAVLAGAAFGLTRIAARVREAARSRNGAAAGSSRSGTRRFAFSYGLAALARPGAGALAAIVALGLGVLVVLAMWLVEKHLVDRLQADLPKNAPSVFLVDIQPDQWPGIEALLSSAGALSIDSVPLVTARLTAIDGVGSDELAGREKKNGERRWALTREQRLTYLEKLPDDNRVIEGTLWGLPEVPEVSVERDFAADLGLTLGSRLDFDVQGVPLTLTVGSLRAVDWETFGINFFWVVEPGVLEQAPQQRVAAVRLAQGDEQRMQDLLVDRFPNVTVLNIRTILDKVSGVLERIGLGIRLLGGFTVLSGIAILAGAVAATAARRGREVALLKTLGLTRGGVARVFSVEYSLLGLVAGAIGTAGGGVLAWVVLEEGMEIPWRFDPVPFVVALAASMVLAVVAGLAASTRALRQRPVEVLRSE